LLSIDNGDFDLLQIISVAVREMSEGELLQIEKARRLDIVEDVYYEIIRKKTASLIATSMAIGAASVTNNEEIVEKMYRIGQDVGIAFQIKDDIFDYGTPGNIGKPTGLDIRERKMTLPLIYALNTSSKAVRAELINIVKNHNEDPKKVQRAIELVIAAGGIEYAHGRMMELKDKALNLLENIEESDAKRALIGLVEYTTQRLK
jgi:octaprenyl-diphosphate synthase